LRSGSIAFRSGEKLRREDAGEHVTIDAFTHPVSPFVNEGLAAGFSVRRMGEGYGSDDDVPRLPSFLFGT